MILDAQEKIKECDIAAIPMCDAKWYENVRGNYERELEYLIGHIQDEIKTEENKIVIDAASKDAHHAMQALFMAARGGG